MKLVCTYYRIGRSHTSINTTSEFNAILMITQAHKKSGMNFTCEYTTPMDFEPLNPNPVSEFPLDPQFSPSLEEMREILEISVSVKAILIYAILNKTIMFSRISSRLVRISL